MPVFSVIMALTAVGLTVAVSNLSSQYHARGNRAAIAQVLRRCLAVFLLLFAAVAAVVVLLYDPISVYLLGDARTRLGLMLLVPCLVLTGIENLQKHYFYGTGRVCPAAVTELIEQILRSVLVLALVWATIPATAEEAVGAIVLGMALCEVTSALTQTVLFRRYLGPRDRLAGAPLPPSTVRRKLGRIALPLGLAALLGNGISSANAVLIPRLLVLGGMDQSQAVSTYGVTFGMTLPMLLLPTAFLSALGLVLTPKLSRCAALQQAGEIRRLVRRWVSLANLILIPALALLAVLGPALGRALYQEERVGDHLPLLALGVLFSCWQSLGAYVLNGVDRQKTSAAIALGADGVQLVLTCLTVGQWGMGGYAVSFVLASLVGAVLSWRAVAQATGLALPIFAWFTAPTLAACLAASCGDLMETVLLRAEAGVLPSALGGMGFGLLLYLAALQAMGVWGGKPERPP